MGPVFGLAPSFFRCGRALAERVGLPKRSSTCGVERQPLEIRGSQLIGRSRITRQRGQQHSMCV
jgi:hypothetical protein